MSAHGWNHKWWGRIRRGWFAAATLALIVLVGLWLTFQHKPAWYQPVRLNEQNYQNARRSSLMTADSISDQLVQGRESELVLSDRMVNEWLAALPLLWPEAKRKMPDEIRDPAVRFMRDRIRLAAHINKDGWQAIISVDLFVRVSGDGKSVTIALAGARGGSLPIPRTIIAKLLRPLIEQTRRGSNYQENDNASPWDAALKGVQSVNDLYAGVTTRNRFVWPNGKRPFRIASIRTGNGELRIQLQPL